jgi:hypothetical protein
MEDRCLANKNPNLFYLSVCDFRPRLFQYSKLLRPSSPGLDDDLFGSATPGQGEIIETDEERMYREHSEDAERQSGFTFYK